jgi:hypothetical protein
MALKTLRKMILSKTETIEGVHNPPNASNALFGMSLEAEADREEITFDRVARSLDKDVTLIGQKRWKLNFGIDFKGAGGTTAVVAPEWDRLIRACGMRRKPVYQVLTSSSTSGAIAHWDPYVSDGGTTGNVVGAYTLGAQTMVFVVADNDSVPIVMYDTLTVTTDLGTEDIVADDDAAAYGYFYHPTSQIWAVATRGAWTGSPAVGEVMIGATSGAVGLLLNSGVAGSGSVYIEVARGTFTNGEVITGQTSGATATLSSGFALDNNWTQSMDWFLDGLRVRTTGNRGNFTLPFRTGQPARIDFEFSGLEQTVDTLPNPAGAVYDTTVPPRFVNARFTMDDIPFFISQLELSIGNALSTRDDANALEGAVSYQIGDRDPGGTIDPELVVPDAYDFFAKHAANILVPIMIALGESRVDFDATTVGRSIWIDIPQVQFATIAPADRNGTAVANIGFKAKRGTFDGDDSIRIFAM